MPELAEGLTIYIKEVSSDSSPNKLSIGQKATSISTQQMSRFSNTQKQMAGGFGVAKILLNNPVTSRIGDYTSKKGTQVTINNIKKIGNPLLNSAIVGAINPIAGGAMLLRGGFNALMQVADNQNAMRKMDVKADYKLDSVNFVLIGNQRYTRGG